MPRAKKTIECEHCSKEFTQARKDQKYCCSQCRFDHFLDKRETQEERLEALQKENGALKAQVRELMAQLQSATIPALMTVQRKN
jgi:hypothetical protein